MTIEQVFKSISDFIPFSIGVIIAVLIGSIILSIVLNFKWLYYVKGFIAIACAPGIALHEGAHYLFARAAGCQVYETNFFYVTKNAVGGYVSHSPSESFIAQLFISIGPIIINGLMSSMVIYLMSYIPEALAYYLVAAFALGAMPSTQDMKNVLTISKQNAGRTVIELFFIVGSFILAGLVSSWNATTIYEVNWLLFVAIYFGCLGGLLLTLKFLTQ